MFCNSVLNHVSGVRYVSSVSSMFYSAVPPSSVMVFFLHPVLILDPRGVFMLILGMFSKV